MNDCLVNLKKYHDRYSDQIHLLLNRNTHMWLMEGVHFQPCYISSIFCAHQSELSAALWRWADSQELWFGSMFQSYVPSSLCLEISHFLNTLCRVQTSFSEYSSLYSSMAFVPIFLPFHSSSSYVPFFSSAIICWRAAVTTEFLLDINLMFLIQWLCHTTEMCPSRLLNTNMLDKKTFMFQ